MSHLLGRIIGTVFGLVFAGFGFFFLFMSAMPLLKMWIVTSDWQAHQAILLSVDDTGNGSAATYRYEYGGTIYEGDRVSLATFNDNIGSYQKNLQQKLTSHFQEQQPIAIWLNPEHPGESIIDRKMRWGLLAVVTIFCSVFIFIGSFICYASFFAKPVAKKNQLSLRDLKRAWDERQQDGETSQSFLDFLEQQRSKQHLAEKKQESVAHVEKPWLERKQWREDGIRSDAKSSAMGMWIFTILWNGVSSPIFFVFADEWQSGNYIVLIALIFPLVGLFLLYKAIATTREYSRYGVILCQLDPYPGSIGGQVGGSLTIANLSDTQAQYRIELQCMYSYVSGSGKNRSRRESTIWAEAGHAKVDAYSKGVRLYFCFDVPENLPQSDRQQSGDYHFWRLKLSAQRPGVDLQRSYNIPVYATTERSKLHYPNLSEQMKKQMQVESDKSKMAMERGDFDKAGLKGAISIRKVDRGLLLVHPMLRNKLLSLFALIFGVSFSGATYAMLTNFSGSGFFALFAVVFSIPFALVGLIGITAFIYLPFNNLRVTISKGEVIVLRRLFFLPIYYRKIQTHGITECSLKKNGSSGQGVNKKEYYSIKAHLKGGKKLTIAEGICGRDIAENFMAYVYRRIRAGY